MESYFHLEPANKVYQLQEITSLIKQSLLDLSSQEFWVRAHLIAPRSSSIYRNYGFIQCSATVVCTCNSMITKIRPIPARYSAQMLTNGSLTTLNATNNGDIRQLTFLSLPSCRVTSRSSPYHCSS